MKRKNTKAKIIREASMQLSPEAAQAVNRFIREAWQRGLDLFELVFKATANVSDFKLRSQVTDAAQSVSANISEGYGRRTLPEYIQFLYYAKGSLGETLTRSIGLHNVGLLTPEQFESIDALHYEVENKLLGLNPVVGGETSR